MRLKVTVCDPENTPLHHIAKCSELKIEFLEYAGAPRTLYILLVEINNASENPTFQKCLEHFKLSPSLIENGKWASVRKGEVILETQINETRKMFPNSLIWAFPKSEMSKYVSFVSLVRSLSMPTAASAVGKWPRGRAHHRPSLILQNTPGSGQVGLISGRGGVMRGHGRGRGHTGRNEIYGRDGRGGHTSTPSTTIFTDAFKSIVSGIVSVVQMAQAA
ncbi:hypothetical protein AGLY_015629 [Aphis glycines]|uniref:Uncharacterized protein n=1 Tax=Aphis glycines TaxID=307491 RepID=A0A6G0T0E9_APHGL|nr:hypothetical protein AGLY_015629 [Aphis glycines]